MSPDYIALNVEGTGYTPWQWEKVRRHCRVVAKERGVPADDIYAEFGVLTEIERTARLDPALRARREKWRARKSRQLKRRRASPGSSTTARPEGYLLR